LTPNSSSCRIVGRTIGPNEEEYLKINVVAVPEKGLANKELVSFLAKKTGLPKSAFELIAGSTAHWKKLSVDLTSKTAQLLEQLDGE
jgi:hypothetical protein